MTYLITVNFSRISPQENININMILRKNAYIADLSCPFVTSATFYSRLKMAYLCPFLTLNLRL